MNEYSKPLAHSPNGNESDYSSPCSIYYCGQEACKAEHSYGPAVRSQYLLHYVTAGRGSYTVGGKCYPIETGQLFLIKPNELTLYQADASTPWSYLWVGFDGYDVKSMLQKCGIGYVTSAPNPAAFTEKMLALLALMAAGGNNEYQMLSVFYGMMGEFHQSKAPAARAFDALYFKKAVSYLINNFAYPITVDEVARHVGIDRTYLYKIFIKHCGVSPKQYLLNLRIQNATRMIAQMEFSLEQIALSSGFNSAPQFCTHFKKAEGITPSQYKKDMLSLRG